MGRHHARADNALPIDKSLRELSSLTKPDVRVISYPDIRFLSLSVFLSLRLSFPLKISAVHSSTCNVSRDAVSVPPSPPPPPSLASPDLLSRPALSHRCSRVRFRLSK